MANLNPISDMAGLAYEGFESQDEYLCALQRQINSGMIWRMEGSMGRAAMDAIKSGQVMLGKEPCFDYWGNRIPARSEITPGAFGSREYVAKNSGEETAAMLEVL